MASANNSGLFGGTKRPYLFSPSISLGPQMQSVAIGTAPHNIESTRTKGDASNLDVNSEALAIAKYGYGFGNSPSIRICFDNLLRLINFLIFSNSLPFP